MDRARRNRQWLSGCLLMLICVMGYAQFAHANLGRVLLGQGKVEEAKRSFERALEHDPEYLPALMGLEHIKRGGFRGL